LISIKPSVQKNTFPCPECSSEQTIEIDLLFQGIHVLANCTCLNCSKSFYHTLPIAHDLFFPISFSVSGSKKKYPEEAKTWLAEPLIQSIINADCIEPVIEKKVFNKHEHIIIINCLDFCYGHVFLKLANIPLYAEKFPEKGLVVIIPEKFEWLIPSSIAEVWVVKEKLSKINKWIKNIDPFIKTNIKNFQSVEIGSLNVHPESTTIDWEKILRTKKFNLSEYNTLPPQITFIYREDRLWLNNFFINNLWKFFKKIEAGNYVKYWFLSYQNMSFARVANNIKRKNPSASFSLIGLGKKSFCPSILKDFRKNSLVESDELEWCAHYAKSHLIIGIHGSNMLIPTALAAGFIELLPEYKIQHITEDIIQRHTNRKAYYLGRFMDEYSSSKLIANHASKMIHNYTLFSRFMENEL
jgi:hypothetical protein